MQRWNHWRIIKGGMLVVVGVSPYILRSAYENLSGTNDKEKSEVDEGGAVGMRDAVGDEGGQG